MGLRYARELAWYLAAVVAVVSKTLANLLSFGLLYGLFSGGFNVLYPASQPRWRPYESRSHGSSPSSSFNVELSSL